MLGKASNVLTTQKLCKNVCSWGPWLSICFFIFFTDGFDFSDGWKKHLEESDKKARVILESYYKKCQENNVSDSCGIQILWIKWLILSRHYIFGLTFCV